MSELHHWGGPGLLPLQMTTNTPSDCLALFFSFQISTQPPSTAPPEKFTSHSDSLFLDNPAQTLLITLNSVFRKFRVRCFPEHVMYSLKLRTVLHPLHSRPCMHVSNFQLQRQSCPHCLEWSPRMTPSAPWICLSSLLHFLASFEFIQGRPSTLVTGKALFCSSADTGS